MCGILGILSPAPVDPERVRTLTRELYHRGPDGEGVFCTADGPPFVAFGHRRLAVIDLASGDQPMLSEDGSRAVVFNGEIYNFRELRRELSEAGHRFRTRSDTEVLLHSYARWGSELLPRLDGMFAFALYDAASRTLLLARDRLGKKPLFYFSEGGRLGFASELGPLLSLKGERCFSRGHLAEYLTHGFVSGPDTCYVGIHRLLPGQVLTVGADGVRNTAYWQLPGSGGSAAARSARDLEEELDQRLRAAVHKRLVSDVPLGAFLSGGLDSSLVVALMARELGPGVETFSIGFEDASFDERVHAARVARHLGVRHTQERVELDGADSLDAVIRAFGEPFGDSSAIPSGALAAVTRNHVTVALSGDGADELLGGYQRYLARRLAAWYLRLPPAMRRRAENWEESRPEGVGYYGASRRKQVRLFLALAGRVERGIEGLPVFFSPEDLLRLFPAWENPPRTYPETLLEAQPAGDILARMMDLDLVTYLPEDILTKVDRMSMRSSLEVRCPFLDHSLVEFCQGVPIALKVRGLTTKYLLKRVGLRYLPRDVVLRRKHGFSVPLGRWFLGALGDRYLEWLAVADAGLDREYAASLLAEHRAGRRDHSQRLWFLYVLLYWLVVERVEVAAQP